MPKLLHLIVACAENRVIGRNGKLPWRIPEDLEFFHDETAGQVCVLGRVCFETWPRVMLDGRRPVVLTSHSLAQLSAARVAGGANKGSANGPVESEPIIARTLSEALSVAEDLPGEIFVCGGERIYAETLALSRPMQLHLTLIHAEIPGERIR